MRRVNVIFLSVLFWASSIHLKAQQDTPTSDTVNSKRLTVVVGSGALLYTTSMVGLYASWYADYDFEPLHLFDDNDAWLQVDKAGHAYSAYHISRVGMKSFQWAGVKDNHAAWYGFGASMLYMTSIEILDGFSSGWGFSMGDFGANVFGASFMLGQHFAFNEQRILLKYSYHPTEFAQYRPDLLGEPGIRGFFKDYNGQTYWASVNIESWYKKNTFIPNWLNVAFGYGGSGMIGGSSNPVIYDGQQMPYFDRYRQYYLSLDIDFERIPTNSKFLKTVFVFANMFKLPFPTLEYNRIDGWKTYLIY